MEANAHTKAVRVSPRKIGVVAALVRGRTVSDALVILEHTPRRAAPILAKTISSAAANARQKHNARVEDLTIERLEIGAGPRMKRYFAAARGRARPYMKRTSHIRVTVSAPEKQVPKTPAPKSTEAKTKVTQAPAAKKEKK